jgi:hypothetical protein
LNYIGKWYKKLDSDELKDGLGNTIYDLIITHANGMLKQMGYNESKKKVNEARKPMVVTSIDDIPNLQKLVDMGKVTYRGLGMGKLWDDFYDLAGEGGTRIKVNGIEYFITDTDYRKLDWDFKNNKWLGKIKFSAPRRR